MGGNGARSGFFYRRSSRKEIQIQYWASCHFLSLVVRPAHGVHPRHPPRTFPLGLLAPRCLGLALLLALPLCGAGARAPCSVWGEEGILPPASVSSSQWFARVFNALFWLVVCVCLCLRRSCLRSPPSHTPFLVFKIAFVVSLPLLISAL